MPRRRNGVPTSIMLIQPSSWPSGSVAAVATSAAPASVDAHQVTVLEEDAPVGVDLIPAGLDRQLERASEIAGTERAARPVGARFRRRHGSRLRPDASVGTARRAPRF